MTCWHHKSGDDATAVEKSHVVCALWSIGEISGGQSADIHPALKACSVTQRLSNKQCEPSTCEVICREANLIEFA